MRESGFIQCLLTASLVKLLTGKAGAAGRGSGRTQGRMISLNGQNASRNRCAWTFASEFCRPPGISRADGKGKTGVISSV